MPPPPLLPPTRDPPAGSSPAAEPPRAREPPHPAHFTCASLGLLPCWPLPNQQFILWQREFGGGGVGCGLSEQAHIVRHYQDNGAIWGTEGSPARLFKLRCVLCAPATAVTWGWHFFCITTDDKGKVIWFPFRAIIAETTRRGWDLWPGNNGPPWSTHWLRLGET